MTNFAKCRHVVFNWTTACRYYRTGPFGFSFVNCQKVQNKSLDEQSQDLPISSAKSILKYDQVKLRDLSESLSTPKGVCTVTPDKSVRPTSVFAKYASLSKLRLTSLILVCTAGGYAIAPGVTDLSILTYTLLGTALSSASANSLNQFFETPYDGQMKRTQSRPLVQGLIRPESAFMFAALTGSLGVVSLWHLVNPTTAMLAAANIVLYSCIYTPLKRQSIACTWVGAVVGAVPLLMAWTAKTGGEFGPGALVLAALLYSWQFPHFNALSWNSRLDYSRAGYRMMSVTHPDLCRRVALRHSAFILALCCAAPLSPDLSLPWLFAPCSLAVNVPLVYLAYSFYRKADASSSRKLFFFSTLFHLPIVMTMMVGFKFLV